MLYINVYKAFNPFEDHILWLVLTVLAEENPQRPSGHQCSVWAECYMADLVLPVSRDGKQILLADESGLFGVLFEITDA